jgi:CTP synthase
LAIFCNVPRDAAISAPDVDNIYDVPALFEKNKFTDKILDRLGLSRGKKDMREWTKLTEKIKVLTKPIKIAVVGKYFGTGDFTLADSYISVIEAAKHASWANNVVPEFSWLDSEVYENSPKQVKELKDYDGVIVPGGFGQRGIEGLITAIRYVREQKIPYLGLCYGLQLATIEFARNVAGIKDATTTEVATNPKHPVIHIMPEQEKLLLENDYGGTMRLGAHPAILEKGSIVAQAYDRLKISERHRHRYEVNNTYRDKLGESGLRFSGTSPDQRLVEIIELPRRQHPFFVGTQFHPEFKSRPLSPHPLFKKFAAVAKKRSER